MNSSLGSQVQGVQEVLRFWLGAVPLDDAAMVRVSPRWFQKDAAFDTELRARFAATLVAALAGRLQAWAADAQGRLALLIVLDQFTRNAFRDQAASFAGDQQARALALEALDLGHDQQVPPLARMFFYLPIEHAEDMAMQERSVALFDELARGAPADGPAAPILATAADYAHRHMDVIQRYGRYPHRNAILGRRSTEAEQQYLAQPGAGF